MDEDMAVRLAQACLPLLAATGVGTTTALGAVQCKPLTRLCSGGGGGGVVELVVTADGGRECLFIVKLIQSRASVEDEHLINHMAYCNEALFYELRIPERLCEAGASCPRTLLVERDGGGAEGGIAICMTKLRSSRRWGKHWMRDAVTWLARLHALFWGKGADDAVAAGLSDHGCFWSLVRRSDELENLDSGDPLRLAAAGIHARLEADWMQTMCHGDAKEANIMWDEEEGVSFYDFQWFGKAPPSKDLAYFIGINADAPQKEDQILIRHYHAELSELLGSLGHRAPTYEELWESYCLALADLWRWMSGGFKFGNTSYIRGHAEAVLGKLQSGDGELRLECEYAAKVFELFPPSKTQELTHCGGR